MIYCIFWNILSYFKIMSKVIIMMWSWLEKLNTCTWTIICCLFKANFKCQKFFSFFSVRLFVGSAWSFGFSSPPQRPMTSDFEGFLYQILSITISFYLNSWERASIFPFQCWVLNKGTTGTIFITSLVWRGPWLGIEPGTSRTRIQHSTTRLSRRR